MIRDNTLIGISVEKIPPEDLGRVASRIFKKYIRVWISFM